MADLLTDDGYAWVVDDARLEEIALLTRMMIEATGHTGPLTQAQIDELLVRAPIVAVPGLGWQDVPAPRTEARTG